MTAAFVRYAIALAAVLCAPGLHAQIVTGPAQAIDGDTLDLTGMRIRLFGIDALEARQSCERGGVSWACGQEARAVLAQLIEGRSVECDVRGTDKYGRSVARCHAGNVDLAEIMVLSGFALALPQFSDAYAASEARAKKFGLGIWNSDFLPPEQWRAANPGRKEPAGRETPRSNAEVPAPTVYRDASGRCAIKGNRSRRGEWIYHLPGRPYYQQTRPEELFCTEEDAARAGYRPSRAH